MEKRRAAFLDRDGVINRLIYHRDHGIVDSPFTLRQFSVLPKVPQAIKDESETALRGIAGVRDVRVLIDIQAPAAESEEEEMARMLAELEGVSDEDAERLLAAESKKNQDPKSN